MKIKKKPSIFFALALSVMSLGIRAGEITDRITGNSLFVSDFGAIPNDGKSDTKQITKAIKYAHTNNKKYVVLDKGVYNLRGDEMEVPTIYINGVENLKLIGQVTNDGHPATTLEVNLPLTNEESLKFSRHIDWRGSKNIGLENIVFDLNPRFSTSGKVVMVDQDEKRVEVEIFEGMSHFEGMKCFSANVWDLETRRLKHMDALTINMQEPYFENLWHRVEKPGKVVYAIKNMPFYDKVKVGDGISWHYAAKTSSGISILFDDCEGLTLKNLHVYNSITLSIKTYDTRDITIKKVNIMPEGNSLAVGPRDGIHLSNPRGMLTVDSIYVKGVRWDPFVSRVNFVTIDEVVDTHTVISVYTVTGKAETMFQVGDEVVFWCGEKPVKRELAAVKVLSNRGQKKYSLQFKTLLPTEVKKGTLVSPPTWEKATITNSVFEDNFGTAIVWENENCVIENNVFRNNSYHAIGFGPTSLNTGAFGENIVIRNNYFVSNGWVNKYSGIYGGAITTFENHRTFSNEPYNTNILIEDNTFEDMNFSKEMGAIGLKNAQDVTIRNNIYRNVKNKVVIDQNSTKDILNEDQ